MQNFTRGIYKCVYINSRAYVLVILRISFLSRVKSCLTSFHPIFFYINKFTNAYTLPTTAITSMI